MNDKTIKYGLMGIMAATSLMSAAVTTHPYNNPPMNKIDWNQPNMFILHKNGCKYCEYAQPGMKKIQSDFNAKNNQKIYMVEVHSDLGKYLVRHYKLDMPFTALVTTGKTPKSKYYKEYEVDIANNRATEKVNSDGVKSLSDQFKNLEK